MVSVNVGQVSLKIDHLMLFNVHFDVISIFAGDAPRLAAVRGPDILPGENHGGKIRDQESH
ncbi:hypothetical protein [Burkholderia arboris]|uniref:hypothetical protein n=1 Tax=Burkholderia arboris TaxID=488730 RepID=UPI001CA4045D|nr:hypothetical protein [Burkholderia arboris]MBY8608225.1 hypothetical protein [Burkholderia arboris]MCA8052042.1 hypothetical protein [Burkholderia arboris]